MKVKKAVHVTDAHCDGHILMGMPVSATVVTVQTGRW